jgi:hypothetical protein
MLFFLTKHWDWNSSLGNETRSAETETQTIEIDPPLAQQGYLESGSYVGCLRTFFEKKSAVFSGHPYLPLHS